MRFDQSFQKRSVSIVDSAKIAITYCHICNYNDGIVFRSKNRCQKNIVKQLVGSYYSIPLSAAISQKAVQLMHDYVSGNRIVSVPDCLIAATSIITGFPLLTFNTRDFEFIEGLKLIKRPF